MDRGDLEPLHGELGGGNFSRKREWPYHLSPSKNVCLFCVWFGLGKVLFPFAQWEKKIEFPGQQKKLWGCAWSAASPSPSLCVNNN